MADYIHFNYAVFLLPGTAHGDALAEIPRLIGRYKNLKLVDKIPERPTNSLISAHFIMNAQKNYTPPSLETLKYRGEDLSEHQQQLLQQSHEAIVLEFAHPKASVWSELRTANELIEDLARKTGGLIFDELTRETFTPDAWHRRRLASWPAGAEVPRVSSQVMIDMYSIDDYHRQITLGMAKMGLPDLVVQELPENEGDSASGLINAVAQRLAEGQAVNSSGKFKLNLHSIANPAARESILKSLKANALGTACVLVDTARRDKGDPDNRLLELSAALYSGPDPHARLDNLLSSLLGHEDRATKVEHTNELLEESRKEKARLPELRKDFRDGLQPGEYIEVKAGFPTPQGNREWMWVEVTRWSGETITGTLDNDPAEIPDLHAGQVVNIRQDDVFDYIRHFPDGHLEGNTTAPILKTVEHGTVPAFRSYGEMPNCD